MKAESIMNTESKWIEVKNTKESGEDSGKIFATLTDSEKKAAQNIMSYRKQLSNDVFYVSDCELSRKLFENHFSETNMRF